jgi:hypothetical protein
MTRFDAERIGSISFVTEPHRVVPPVSAYGGLISAFYAIKKNITGSLYVLTTS